jgi:hypothetical protein
MSGYYVKIKKVLGIIYGSYVHLDASVYIIRLARTIN